ncbi:tight adherence pilus pseudopilin TadF [Vibrio nigripulchritudo]|uniref:tight adherence pilus pseudopilin TadF n=1 Tax=Vibrio nigripulchritudo TaxID=28173 RepID=UPI0005FA3C83|nr:tight adherence pilus pseudopilin TadF [Vibrio nigripulchritudo]KJY74787.1 ATP-binding protein [Vibrio nigripulchritudo]
MSVTNSNTKQKGNFTVEFAIVGAFIALLLVFSADIIVKVSTKGKLDRLSYSLVNVLKERTQLYGNDYKITQAEVSAIMNIGTNSLQRTLGGFELNRFGFLVEELSFRDIGQPNPLRRFPSAQNVCQVRQNLSQLRHLSVVTSWERQTPLYRITLCYETDNWYGSIAGQTFTTVTSSSVMLGR